MEGCLAMKPLFAKAIQHVCFICQVQDVGLIFLSSMATSIVHEGMSNKSPKEEILGTTLFTLTLSTFIVGLLIILVGETCWIS